MKTLRILLILLIELMAYGCGSSPSIRVDGIQSKVVKVLSGNAIELQNGLIVEILGIKPSEHTKEYLEKHVKGQSVMVISDSKQPQYVKSMMTQVRAYVKVKGEKQDVSGKLLLNKTAQLRQTFVTDSIKPFAKYAKGDIPRKKMSSSELLTYMKPATFMIRTEHGMGTGFFINDNGLALTNNHVLNNDDGIGSVVIYFFGNDGKIDNSNFRHVERIIITERGEKIDYTIFQVKLDNGEKVKYLPLVDRHLRDGEVVAKLGCPIGEPCNFQTGVLSNYKDGYFAHSISSNHGDSGGPIVNFKGEAVGINQSIAMNSAFTMQTGSVQRAEGIAYAVDAMLIRNILDKNNISYGR